MTTGAKGDRTDTATGEASPRRRPGGARPNGPLLELTQIVDVAAELTAEQGLDRVSMRQLGERLGVTSMAIYWYVENRAALIDALLERVCSMIPIPDASLPWDRWLTQAATDSHRVLSRYPGLADELLTNDRRPPSLAALAETARQRLGEAGMGEPDASVSLSVLGTFVTARAQVDAHVAHAAAPDDESVPSPEPTPAPS